MKTLNKNTEILKVMALAMEIQNQGVNDVLIDYAGHVDSIHILVLDGKFETGLNEEPVYNRYVSAENRTSVQSLAYDLRLILEKGVQALPDYQAIKAKEREAKIKRFEALKAELGKEAA